MTRWRRMRPTTRADEAQPIPNPVTVGGYANEPGAGAAGRSSDIGDADDYFAVSLTDEQQITLTIAEPASADLDLYLFDEFRNVVDSSVGITQLESVAASTPGDYFINVRAFSGASNYTLVVGQAPLAAGPRAARLTDEFVPGEIIVRTKTSTTGDPNGTFATAGLALGASGLDGMALLRLTPEAEKRIMSAGRNRRRGAPRFRDTRDHRKWQTLMAVKALAADPEIEFAEPNYLYRPLATPNDSFYSFQWHYPLINLPAAWDLETGSSNVTVAVIDSGILAGHPDFQGTTGGPATTSSVT